MPLQRRAILHPKRRHAKRFAVARQRSGDSPRVLSTPHPVEVTKFPSRPDPDVLSEAIPLFLIFRNKGGLWVARESEGRVGGVFLRKQSALRFAQRNTQPGGCATMFLSESFELDIENKGKPLLARLGVATQFLLGLAHRFLRSTHDRSL
jgi:hypothetical protein